MLRMKEWGILCAIIAGFVPGTALAFCTPPMPPALTSGALAREFEPEFRQNFEGYFIASTAYFRCLDDERRRVMAEIEDTAQRYDRFLTDAETWNTER